MEWFVGYYGFELNNSLEDLYKQSFTGNYSFKDYIRFFFYIFFIGFFIFYFFYLFKGIFYDIPTFGNRWVENNFDYYMNMSNAELYELQNRKKHIFDDVMDARNTYKRWMEVGNDFERNFSKVTGFFFILIVLFFHPAFEFIQIK